MSIDRYLHLAAQERILSASATVSSDAKRHFMMAELYADQAWSLNEAGPTLDFIASGLWPIDASRRPLR